MTEPRMRARAKGQQFPTDQLEDLLYAFGSPVPCLPETVRVLDEMLTDFIIELCHTAALSAQLAHRAKIKVDDFKFALRKDARKLGRAVQMSDLKKSIEKQRQVLKDDVVADGIVKGERGKGRGKRVREAEEGSEGEGLLKKKVKKGRKGKSEVKSEVVDEDDEGDEEVGEE